MEASPRDAGRRSELSSSGVPAGFISLSLTSRRSRKTRWNLTLSPDVLRLRPPAHGGRLLFVVQRPFCGVRRSSLGGAASNGISMRRAACNGYVGALPRFVVVTVVVNCFKMGGSSAFLHLFPGHRRRQTRSGGSHEVKTGADGANRPRTCCEVGAGGRRSAGAPRASSSRFLGRGRAPLPASPWCCIQAL